ncbi:DUF4365 domain-containing protein [Arthrobacter antibioticus]|uniref:DUF4365 domain-containing protein n=1 Tax=Arthrobacter sp. H35-MC1 TaxID=3046203 RepID=UPI0024BAAF13|nr:DUF4365 domain-containing protein [Arthrobacter sp. H35-MC1]MDJ0318358.1 DUF4365 domain-containing protein [Arthrobacter sp. H35-MC1]
MGIAGVSLIVHGDLKWILREQPTSDFGIDVQIEVVDGRALSGKLIAAQIKSGKSYFKATSGGWWFYPKARNLDYWLAHALPVIVVFYNAETRKAYWESVEPAKILPTRKGGRKLLIPESKELGADSCVELSKLADGNPYDLRVRQLRLALPWMRLLDSGRRVLLEAEEWINKTSGRGSLTLVSVDDANEDRQLLGEWGLLAGLESYDSVLPKLAPWADVGLHEETYDEADHDEWEAECVFYDEDCRVERQSYSEWHSKFDETPLRPYSNVAGEVDFWRLEMELNDLGRGFLLLDEFASGDGLIIVPGEGGE